MAPKIMKLHDGSVHKVPINNSLSLEYLSVQRDNSACTSRKNHINIR